MANFNIVILYLNQAHIMIEIKILKFQEDMALLNILNLKILSKLNSLQIKNKFYLEK